MTHNNPLAARLIDALDHDTRSDYQIAKDAGIYPERIYKLRAGKGCTLDTAEKLCRVLGLELREKTK